MFADDMAAAVRKAHIVVFGFATDIVLVSGLPAESKFGGCLYIPAGCPVEKFNDPALVEVAARVKQSVDHFIIFEDRIDRIVREATFDRDHIKPVTIIWSIVIKAIWFEVRVLFRRNNPHALLQEVILTPEEIALCLPKGHEFPNNFDEMSHTEIIEYLYEREISGFRTEFVVTPKQEEQGILHAHVEQAVISAVAVLCKNESQMLGFVKCCKDLALAQP